MLKFAQFKIKIKNMCLQGSLILQNLKDIEGYLHVIKKENKKIPHLKSFFITCIYMQQLQYMIQCNQN